LTRAQQEVYLIFLKLMLFWLLSDGDLSPADRERRAALVRELNERGLGIATLAIEE
jgi:hypothetical protein